MGRAAKHISKCGSTTWTARVSEQDAVYTPPAIAESLLQLIRSIRRKQPIIADFSAGEGELLRAARKRWPHAALVANDAAARPVQKLRRALGPVRTASCDFFDTNACGRSRTLRSVERGCDIILANPPFSARGGMAKRLVVREGPIVRGSPAGIYLLRCTAYLRRRGRLLAIMPASFESSEKDAEVRSRLRALGRLTIESALPSNAFPSYRPNTVIVAFRLGDRSQGGQQATPQPLLLPAATPRLRVVLVRGLIPNGGRFSKQSQMARFAHTTHVAKHGIEFAIARVPDGARSVRGPSLLLPRIGQPRLDKVATYRGRVPLYLSDCLFALTVQQSGMLDDLLSRVRSNWFALRDAYSGTGAPYLTITKLVQVLQSLKVDVITRSKVASAHIEISTPRVPAQRVAQ